MSTTQKIKNRQGLKVAPEQRELFAACVRDLVGDAGKVEVSDSSSKGLAIKSRHYVAESSKYADIRVRLTGASADIGIYYEEDGSVSIAWDSYVVGQSKALKEKLEGRADRNTFEANLNASFVARTFEQTALDNGMISHGIQRVTNEGGKTGRFEIELDTGFGGGLFDKKEKQTLGTSLGGGL